MILLETMQSQLECVKLSCRHYKSSKTALIRTKVLKLLDIYNLLPCLMPSNLKTHVNHIRTTSCLATGEPRSICREVLMAIHHSRAPVARDGSCIACGVRRLRTRLSSSSMQ